MENGYHLYDFKGALLREEAIEGFKQLLWRPRPATLLSKEEQAEIRKNLRNYSKVFDEQDVARKSSANKAVVEARREMLEEWRIWREEITERLREEGADVELAMLKGETPGQAEDGHQEEIEEIVEEILEENEEVIG
jgi:translation initiation factor 3 subunit B